MNAADSFYHSRKFLRTQEPPAGGTGNRPAGFPRRAEDAPDTPSNCRSAKLFPFSAEELYFQLLRQAKLEAPGDSYTKLEELHQRYVQGHPSFGIELKTLISGGWLDCFCNRWALVGCLSEHHAKSAEDVRVKAVVEFLLWLQEQVPVERSAVYLENWDAALAEMRRRCPETPDTEWFPAPYPLCETRLKEHLAWGKRQNYTHPMFDRDYRQLSYLWLLRGDYELLFSKGHPYVQTLALLEGPRQDLRKAASLWESLAEETREPRAYLYWMQAYVRQLEETPKEQTDHRQGIYRKIEALRQSIEKGPFISWEQEEQLHYADILARVWKEQGMDRTLIVKRAAQALPLPEKTLLDHWGEFQWEHKAVVELPAAPVVSSGQMEDMLLHFLSLPLASKAGIYFHCRLARAPKQSDTALVYLELFRTLYHLSNYGDKLLVNTRLDEDHCTQLFREIFNLNGSEWWKLSANDQQQSGSTGRISKSGLNISAENDFLVKSENYTHLFAKAMKLERMGRADLELHLKKLIGDNIQNAPMLLLIYGNSLQPQKLWKELQFYFHNQFPSLAESMNIRMASFVEFQDCALYIPELYAPMEELVRHSITTHVSHHGGESLPLVITYADIGKQAHMVISREARKK